MRGFKRESTTRQLVDKEGCSGNGSPQVVWNITRKHERPSYLKKMSVFSFGNSILLRRVHT